VSALAAVEVAGAPAAARRDLGRFAAGLDVTSGVQDSGGDPELVLGPALFNAVLQVVRSELQSRLAGPVPARTPWMTPPAACRVTRIPVKTIRAWVRDGRIPKRLKNRSADPKQQKYLVNVEDVIAAAEQPGFSGPAADTVTDVRERAQQILAARAAKGR
jgi:hypothetical protein